ncbi:MAG TPA: hypothetical protein VHF25_14360 [Nitriliruptorales bacterium]|nr:hypothetical protein [Nitriliruptorales bacterium]
MSDEARVLVRREGRGWRLPAVTRYRNERELQDLMMDAPALIPGVSSAAVADELHLPGTGSVDILMVEPTGALTLVECKLADNPEIRRAVVGQIFAYAGAMWRMSYDDLDRAFASRAGHSLADAVAELVVDEVTWEEESFRTAVGSNLADGRFRLVIAVDAVTDELKSIIEFLNVHTDSGVELLGLELAYLADEGLEMLLPRTHGSEAARLKTRAVGASRTWGRPELLAALTELVNPQASAAVAKLLDRWQQWDGRFAWGTGAYPSVSGHFTASGTGVSAWSIYADPAGAGAPRISINFGSLRKLLDRHELAAMRDRLSQLPGVAERLADVADHDYNRHPTVQLTVAVQSGLIDELLAALEAYVLAQPS